MADAAVAAFHDAHEALYGYCFRDKPEQRVEWVNLRVTGVGPIPKPSLARPAPSRGGVERPAGERLVCFDGGFAPTPIYWRGGLAPGSTVEGPAVIEEYGATVPVHPGFTVQVDDYGNLVVRRSATVPRGEA
jgi:N-methylhydantoinase A